MPLFFFLAGLFLPHSVRERSLVEFLNAKFRTIVYPYVVWSCLTIFLKASLGSIPNSPRTVGDLALIAYSPVEQYWFLYALSLQLLFFALALYANAPKWVIATGCLFLAMFGPSTGWAIFDTALSYAIFFGAGVLIERWLNYNLALSQPLLALICVGCAVVPLVFPVQPFAAFAGICFSIALAQLLANRFSVPLEVLGQYSLEIYVMHTIASAGTRVLLLQANVLSPAIHLVMGCLAGVFVPLYVGIVSRRYFPYAFGIPARRA
jgi:fucose 4-O-acetylase-like acetyltransferase